MDNVIEYNLYAGKVKVKFLGPTTDKPKRHMYYANGVRQKGVTTIIGNADKSAPLMSWQQDETTKSLLPLVGKKLSKEDIVKAVYAHEEAKDKAAELGTQVHDWIERFIKFKLKTKGATMPDQPEDKNVARGVLSFMEWYEAHKVKFLWAEKVLYSKKYGYMGKGDFGAVVDGKRCLCDIKTGNGMYNSVFMQTAAYQKADEEESGEEYEGRWAIRISKETEAEYQTRMTFKNEIKAILGKETYEVKPYQVFEAMFLDEKPQKVDEDYKAFLHLLGYGAWNEENKMY